MGLKPTWNSQRLEPVGLLDNKLWISTLSINVSESREAMKTKYKNIKDKMDKAKPRVRTEAGVANSELCIAI